VVVLAREGLDMARWQRLHTPADRLDYVLDVYVQRRLHEPIDSQAYPPRKQPSAPQIRYWLRWVAKQLKAQSKDEFLIEQLQPKLGE